MFTLFDKETHRLDFDQVPERIIITGDPGRVRKFIPLLDSPKEQRAGPINFWLTGKYKKKKVGICSTGIGSAATALCVTSLIKSGARTIIRLGSAGGMRSGQKLGDFVVPTGAIRDEGASSSYAPLAYPAVATHHLVAGLIEAINGKNPYHTGVIWTSDVFYSSAQKLARWFNRTEAIEMECATLFILAAMSGVSSGALLVLDGNCSEGNLKEKFQHPKKFTKAMNLAISVVLDAVVGEY